MSAPFILMQFTPVLSNRNVVQAICLQKRQSLVDSSYHGKAKGDFCNHPIPPSHQKMENKFVLSFHFSLETVSHNSVYSNVLCRQAFPSIPDPPASTSQVLRLQMFPTMSRSNVLFYIKIHVALATLIFILYFKGLAFYMPKGNDLLNLLWVCRKFFFTVSTLAYFNFLNKGLLSCFVLP